MYSRFRTQTIFIFTYNLISLHCFLKYQSLLMSWLFGWNHPTQDTTFLSEMKSKASRTIIIFPFGFLSPSHSYFWKVDKDLNWSVSFNRWKPFTCQELTLKDFSDLKEGLARLGECLQASGCQQGPLVALSRIKDADQKHLDIGYGYSPDLTCPSWHSQLPISELAIGWRVKWGSESQLGCLEVAGSQCRLCRQRADAQVPEFGLNMQILIRVSLSQETMKLSGLS